MKSKVQHILALKLNIIIWERIQKYNDIEKIEMYSLKSMNAITKKTGITTNDFKSTTYYI